MLQKHPLLANRGRLLPASKLRILRRAAADKILVNRVRLAFAYVFAQYATRSVGTDSDQDARRSRP